MTTETGFIPSHGNYTELLSYQKSLIVYSGTVLFCNRFLNKRDRTVDQSRRVVGRLQGLHPQQPGCHLEKRQQRGLVRQAVGLPEGRVVRNLPRVLGNAGRHRLRQHYDLSREPVQLPLGQANQVVGAGFRQVWWVA